MKLKKAIEVLKQHKSTTEKFKMTVGTDKISEAIDTVLSHITTPNKTGLDDSLQDKLIEHADNQEGLSSKKDKELPTNEQIDFLVHEFRGMPMTVNPKGLRFKFHCSFVNGARWMRDLILERSKK